MKNIPASKLVIVPVLAGEKVQQIKELIAKPDDLKPEFDPQDLHEGRRELIS